MAKSVFKEPPLPEDAIASVDRQRRACLLVNPVGGTVAKDHGEQVAGIWTALRAAGIWAEIIETKQTNRRTSWPDGRWRRGSRW